MSFDRALRTLTGLAQLVAPDARRAISPNAELSDDERRLAAGLMRVNHTGEVCAQALYAAQALVARDPAIGRALRGRRARGGRASRVDAARLAELDDRPSLLNPLWYAGSFAIGAVAGLAGDRVNLGFVVETERQVEEHLTDAPRPAARAATRRAARSSSTMRADEARHGAMAQEAGAIGAAASGAAR